MFTCDEHTARSVLDLLKSLSAECLVLVVSHSLESARKYADRIIELSEGHIVSDVERDSSLSGGLVIDGADISIPADRPMTDDELAAVNAKISVRKNFKSYLFREKKATF